MSHFRALKLTYKLSDTSRQISTISHMVPQGSRPSIFSPDSLIEAAELQILKHEAERAAKQPPWDGENCAQHLHSTASLQLHGKAVSCICRLLRACEDV